MSEVFWKIGVRMKNDKTIDYRFKILYAVGMVLVVSGHIIPNGGISILSDWFPPNGYHRLSES